LVAKNGKGALCVDFKVMPGARHAFADIPPNALLDPPWHLKLIGNDGREINRTLTLTREGRELVWACDGDEVERYGLLVLVKDPTVN